MTSYTLLLHKNCYFYGHRKSEQGEGAYMIPLMCFSTSTRFVKTSQLSPTLIVLCCIG